MSLALVCLFGLVPLFASWQEAVDASRAQQPSAPIVVYVSRSNCTFCARFENDVLGPVINSGEYDTVVFREIVLDRKSTFADFNLLQRYQIVGTPTVLFLDQTGREVAKRYVGHVDNDYAVYRFERSLRAAQCC